MGATIHVLWARSASIQTPATIVTDSLRRYEPRSIILSNFSAQLGAQICADTVSSALRWLSWNTRFQGLQWEDIRQPAGDTSAHSVDVCKTHGKLLCFDIWKKKNKKKTRFVFKGKCPLFFRLKFSFQFYVLIFFCCSIWSNILITTFSTKGLIRVFLCSQTCSFFLLCSAFCSCTFTSSARWQTVLKDRLPQLHCC